MQFPLKERQIDRSQPFTSSFQSLSNLSSDLSASVVANHDRLDDRYSSY